ncbi:MAG: polysaccharide deacetylase family protein [Chitinophagales bacterium]|nr:polysaccharide deacetylase family protein [Hyphomicrobiales bacterium]
MVTIRQAAKTLAKRIGVTRDRAARARMFSERHALASVVRNKPRSHGRILCYHSVGQSDWGVNDVPPELFRRQIQLALHAGFRFVPPSLIAETGGSAKDLAVSFDDGLTSVLTNAAPILRDFNIPWSLFVVTGWAEGHHDWADNVVLKWRELETLLSDGVELGSHSITHPNFGKLEINKAIDELEGSRRTFSDRLGFAPTSFGIPFGQSANWTPATHDAARRAGYEVIYAQAEETRPPGTIARTFVTKYDGDRIFRALLRGAYDRWEEWY